MNRRTPRSQSLRRTKANQQVAAERVTLERVLGFTAQSNSSLALDQNSGTVAYPAGLVVVGYNTKRNKQQYFLKNVPKKAITAVEFSKDGKFIATGESGHQPMVRVWSVEDRVQVAEYSGHHFRVSCLAFSSSGRYLVSVGSHEDMHINVWDRGTNHKLSTSKVTSKVNAVTFSDNGQFFVTVGNRHVRFWYMDVSRAKVKETIPLQGRNAILGDFMVNNFTDVGICAGRDSSAGQTFTFVVSQAGQLFQFNEQRYLDKWVDLKTTRASCLSVCDSCILVGCASGIIRIFDTITLHYITNLPLPHSLGVDLMTPTDDFGSGGGDDENNSDLRYPDVIAAKYDAIHSRVTCLYNDHSLYVWDLRDVSRMTKLASHLFHSAGVWAVETCPDQPLAPNLATADDLVDSLTPHGECPLPPCSFVTCADDDTIRVWNLGGPYMTPSPGGISAEEAEAKRALFRNDYSNDLVKIIYVDPMHTFLCEMERGPEKADAMQEAKRGIRTVHVSPDGRQLAAGDKEGNLRVYTLDSFEELCTIEAHESEILSLHYFQSHSAPELMLLCSASRDRLIHVFDPNQGFSLVQTLDDHSGAIFASRLVETPDSDVRLVSCGMDKSLLFRVLEPDDQGESARFYLKHHLNGKYSQHDICLTPGRRYAVVACQDRQLRVYNLVTGKQRRCYKGSLAEDGPLLRCAIDPTGTYVVTAGADKQIYLLDFLTGEVEASFGGHSELVLGVRFLPDLRRLVTGSADGCLMVWRLPNEMSLNMRRRQRESQCAAAGYGQETETGPAEEMVRSDVFPSNLHAMAGFHRPTVPLPHASSLPPPEPPSISSVSKPNTGGVPGGIPPNPSIVNNQQPVSPAFRFSVSALPAWAQRKFSRRDSVAISQLNEESLSGSQGADSSGGTSGYATWSDRRECGSIATEGMAREESSEPAKVTMVTSGGPPRMVQDDDAENLEEDGDDEFTKAKAERKRALFLLESCDLESLRTTSTGDDDEDDSLSLPAPSNSTAPSLTFLEQLKLRQQCPPPLTTILSQDSTKTCVGDYPVIKAAIPVSATALPHQMPGKTPTRSATKPSSLSFLPATPTSTGIPKSASSVSMPATPLDVDEDDDHTQDSLEGDEDDDCMMSPSDGSSSRLPGEELTSSGGCEGMEDAGETMAYLCGDSDEGRGSRGPGTETEGEEDMEGGISGRQSLSARFYSKTQPRTRATDLSSEKNLSSSKTSLEDTVTKRENMMSQAAEATRRRLRQMSQQRNPVPVRKTPNNPGPPSVRTRSVSSRKSSTDTSVATTPTERKRVFNFEDASTKKTTRSVKRAESARGPRTPLSSTTGSTTPRSTAPQSGSTMSRNKSRERQLSGQPCGLSKPSSRGSASTCTTPRGPYPPSASRSDNVGFGGAAGSVKKATSMTSVASSGGQSSHQDSEKVKKGTPGPSVTPAGPLKSTSKEDSAFKSPFVPGTLDTTTPRRTKWDRQAGMRQRRETRKTCPVFMTDLDAARKLVDDNNRQRRGESMDTDSLVSRLSPSAANANKTLTGTGATDSHVLVRQAAAFIQRKETDSRGSVDTASATSVSNGRKTSEPDVLFSNPYFTNNNNGAVPQPPNDDDKSSMQGGFNQPKWGITLAWLADKDAAKSAAESSAAAIAGNSSSSKEHVIDDDDEVGKSPANQNVASSLTGSSAGGSTVTLASTSGDAKSVSMTSSVRPPVDVESIISGILNSRQTSNMSANTHHNTTEKSIDKEQSEKMKPSVQNNLDKTSSLLSPKSNPTPPPSQKQDPVTPHRPISSGGEMECERERPISTHQIDSESPDEEEEEECEEEEDEDNGERDMETDNEDNQITKTTAVRNFRTANEERISIGEAMHALREALTAALVSSQSATDSDLVVAKDVLMDMEPELASLRARCGAPSVYVDPRLAELLMRDFGERLCSHFEQALSSSTST